ncbi:hypothetical protein ACFL2H_03945 [Planctomycetota bacterium]
MSYTAYLYGHRSAEFAERLETDAESLVDAVSRWLAANELDSLDGVSASACIEIVRSAKWQPFEVYTQCLEAVAEATMEAIRIPELGEFRSFSNLEEFGLIPGLLTNAAPYPLHCGQLDDLAVGFLPWSQMATFSFSDDCNLGMLSNEEIEFGRDEFRGVLESLVDDQLDLLALFG